MWASERVATNEINEKENKKQKQNAHIPIELDLE